MTEDFVIQNDTDDAKRFVARTVFGGNSNCWAGQTPRFHPSDFTVFEDHGMAAPWPVSYGDLESYYVAVEKVMEVAGGASDHLMPRSEPFPFPPHTMTRADRICHEKRPDIWVPCATARSNGGARPGCCGNLVCGHCPIDAKFTILNGLGHFDRPNLTVMTGAEVQSVLFQGGVARSVGVRTRRGNQVEISGDAIALGANAIFNAAILLRSDVRSEALGHYLHEEGGRFISLDVAVPGYFGASMVSGFCYGAYDGEHRKSAAAVLIESHNVMLRPRMEKNRWTDQMSLVLVADDLPQFDNAVTLDAKGEVVIKWTGHSDYSQAGLDRAEAMLQEFIPFEIERVADRQDVDTMYHIQGTHRMGSDPTQSVVDHSHRVHGHDNLFALGAGAFPTCSPSNPTLTLAALALRAGQSL